MTKKITLFSVLFTFFTLITIAQRVKPDSIIVDHNNEKLIIGEAIQDDDEEEFRFTEEQTKSRPFTRKDLFIRYENASWVPIGKRGKAVEKLLKNHPAALKEFKKYKRKIVWGKSIIFISGGLGIGLSIYTQNFLPVIFLLGGGGTVGVLLETSAEKHLYRAIEIYNADIIKEK